MARFRCTCIDTANPASDLATFWAALSGGTVRAAESGGPADVIGRAEHENLLVVPVPEPKTVKNRVHLDVYARSIDDLTVRLAPLYDTVPTVLWPKLRADGAMTIGGRKKLADVTLDDLVTEARTWAHPEDRARAAATATAEQALAAAADGLLDTVPELSMLVADRARSLLAQAS